MRLGIAITCAALLVLTSCGGSSGTDSNGSDSSADNGATSTADIDVCALLSDEELVATIGRAPASKPSEPAGPFTGCSWGGGLLIVSIAPAVTLITAPSDKDCPTAGIGDESAFCSGLKFLTNGIHTSVSTIENLSDAQLIAVATTLLPKLQD
jgi:hypothetical protein